MGNPPVEQAAALSSAGEASGPAAKPEGPILVGPVRELADRIVAKYPVARSALVPLLYLVQSEVGWVPREGLQEVGELLGLTTAEVEAVATFYTMVKLRPCGRYVISVCTNPSCSIRGGRRLFERARDELGEDAERVTDDGLLTLEEEECLAACDGAPVVAVNYVYYDRVTDEGLDAIIEGIRSGSVPEASRGGAPGDLKTISRLLAGEHSLRPAAATPAPASRSGGTDG